MRVSACFGKRTLTGFIVDIVEHSDFETTRLKPVLEILDKEPVIDNKSGPYDTAPLHP